MTGLPVAKGHGTENDFVLVPDPDAVHHLTPGLVAALCDRRAGLGGDGLIRIVRCADLAAGVEQASEAEWFMDYRNADGSVAEMCGNGLRVFVRYLVHLGLAELDDGESIKVGTRAGVKHVRRVGDLLAADLGPWRITGGQAAADAGADTAVALAGEPVDLPGLRVDVGNPHVVVAVPDAGRLAAADLRTAPVLEPGPDGGANVELVLPLHSHGDAGPGGAELRMRVHERGVGETRSCGTGAVASVLAARVWAGDGAPDHWQVDVPGGRLRVTTPAGQLVQGLSVELAGPAVLVAEGHLQPSWLRAHGA